MAAAEGNAVSTLRDYLEVLNRRRWVLLGVVVLVPVVAVLMSLRQPALYEASAEVLISRGDLATQLEGLSDPTTLDPERTAQTQAQLARVPEVARRTLEAARLDRSPSDLFAASSVTPTSETDFLVFRVRDADPDVAALLVNEYARQFTIYGREFDSRVLTSARERVQSEMEALEARGKGDGAAYNSLLEKNQQLLTLDALQTGQTVLVRPAAGAEQIRPQPQRAAAIGLVLGLALGLALAFLYEALDSRVRSAREVAARLRLPLLGRVSPPPRHLRRSKQLVMLSAPYSKEAEAFRILRSNLELAALDPLGPILMVTSAQSGEGKSTTIANLAIAFAQSGRRTVLVDLDLRNSFLEGVFGLEGRPGVSDIVSGDITLDEALVTGPSPTEGQLSPIVDEMVHKHLSILPSGQVSNPAYFGTVRGVAEMLKHLSARADVVLVDAPPLLLTGDAIALTKHVDGIIVVTRANLIRAATLDELHRALDVAPTPKLGVVLTGSKEVVGYYAPDYELATRDLASSEHQGGDIDAPPKAERDAMVSRKRY